MNLKYLYSIYKGIYMSPIEDLFVTKEQIIETLITKSKGIIGIEKDKKEMIFLKPMSSFTDKELVALFLFGKFFLKEAGFIEDIQTSLDEMSDKTMLDKKAISKRIYELKNEGIVNSTDKGIYEIVYTNIESLLDEIRSKE